MSQRLPLPGTVAISVFVAFVPELCVRGVTISCDVVVAGGGVDDFAGVLEPQPVSTIKAIDLHITAEDTEGPRPNVREACRLQGVANCLA
jgi:hypothetical protein